MHAAVAKNIRSTLTAPSGSEAEGLLDLTVTKYSVACSRPAHWMQPALPEGFTVFMLPQNQRRRLLHHLHAERVNEETKRRTLVATLFPNEGSLLDLVTAVLWEINEDWETGKIYLTPQGENPTP